MRTITSAFLALALIGTGARADEEKVPLDKLPRPVADAVKKRFEGAELLEAAKEVENGKTVYEVSLKHNDQKMDVTLTPEGKIETIEKEITIRHLPKVIKDALAFKFARSSIQKVEELIKVKDGEEKLEGYEVLLTTPENKTYEVVFGPNGKVVKSEEKKEKKE